MEAQITGVGTSSRFATIFGDVQINILSPWRLASVSSFSGSASGFNPLCAFLSLECLTPGWSQKHQIGRHRLCSIRDGFPTGCHGRAG